MYFLYACIACFGFFGLMLIACFFMCHLLNFIMDKIEKWSDENET